MPFLPVTPKFVGEGSMRRAESLRSALKVGDAEYLELKGIAQFPNSAEGLAQVDILEISKGKFSELPDALGALPKLRYLDLSDNPRLTRLPDGLRQARALRRVVLTDVPALDLAQAFDVLSSIEGLRDVHLGGTSFNGLPAALPAPPRFPTLTIARTPESVDLDAVLEVVARWPALEGLGLYSNTKSALPRLGVLGNLQRLEIVGEVRMLPDDLAPLRRLTHLGVRSSELTSLPASIGELQNLVALEITWSKLTALPDSLCRLRNLRRLDLTRNELTRLPEQIGNLSALTELVLPANKIDRLPESFAALTALETIDLPSSPPDLFEHVDVTRLVRVRKVSGPRWPGRLTEPLREFALTDAEPGLPDDLSALETVTVYSMPAARLEPALIGLRDAERPRHLKINYWEEPDLPEGLCGLAMLESLEISSHKLRRLPDRIGDLGRLKRLSMPSCHVEELPVSFADLQALTDLNISLCDFHAFPKILPRLSSLRSLGGNFHGGTYHAARTLEGLEGCHQLEALAFRLPGEYDPVRLHALTNLRVLRVDLPSPRQLEPMLGVLAGAKQLEELNILVNSLAKPQIDVPETLGRLTNLRYLKLEGTLELPDSVGELGKLEELNLESCRPTRFPETLARCTRLSVVTARLDLEMEPNSKRTLRKLLPGGKWNRLPGRHGLEEYRRLV